MDYIDRVTARDLEALMDESTGPCVSIYLPTTPITPDTDQDQIRLKNARAEAFEQLTGQGVRRPDAQAVLEPVDELLEDEGFWPYLTDGLALFLSPAGHHVYRLPYTPEAHLSTGRRFLVKPLLPMLASDGSFYVLALSMNEVRLFQGTHHHGREIQVSDLPPNMAAALNSRGREGARLPNKLWHGDEGQKYLYRKFFRQVDRGLRPMFNRTSSPLVLAGVDYLLPIYQEVSSYRELCAEGVHGNPEHLSAADLHDRAWPIVAASMQRQRQAALDRFGAQRGTGRASDNLEVILGAALDGRVGALFLDLEATAYGSFDLTSRTLQLSDEPGPDDVDLYAQAGRWAFRTGAEIFCGKPPDIPEGGPISAVFRY